MHENYKMCKPDVRNRIMTFNFRNSCPESSVEVTGEGDGERTKLIAFHFGHLWAKHNTKVFDFLPPTLTEFQARDSGC